MLFNHPLVDLPLALLFFVPGVLGPLLMFVLLSDEGKRDVSQKPFRLVVRAFLPVGLFFGGTTVLSLLFLNLFRQEPLPAWRLIGTFLQGAIPSCVGFLVGWRLLYWLLKGWLKGHPAPPTLS